jgi:rhombotail lipoprotein
MKTRLALAFAAVSSLLLGCGAAPPSPGMAPEARIAVAAAPMPAPIASSMFSKDSSGSLSENDLQKILEAPLDLELPARVGVVPLAAPFEPQGKVTLAIRATASRDLARSLTGNQYFSHVSDVSTELPNSGGLEGLRIIAARYRMRYLLLYTERFQDDTHVNGWAWLYPTIIGMFAAPGVTVKSSGLLQADLFDVRTGTILFSAVQPVHVEEKEQMIGAARAHQEHQAKAASDAAKALAKLVSRQVNELVAAADEAGRTERKVRLLPPPVMPQGGTPGSAVSHTAR